MDAFETLVAMLLKREGYWTSNCVKVTLDKREKRRIGRPSSPRWEIDVLAYKGATNEVLAVECKSLLDSTGVIFRVGKFEREARYKLFSDAKLRRVVLKRLAQQLVESGACRKSPKMTLGLAIGKTASRTSLDELRSHFCRQGWILFDPEWIYDHLQNASRCGYENDIACIVSKLILRRRRT